MPAKYDGTNDAAFDGVARLMAELGVAKNSKHEKKNYKDFFGPRG